MLHPCGWMIWLYNSRIDYFGGLLEIKIIGDSIIANYLCVTNEAVLEESHRFEICAPTIPATRLCMRIEKTHHTHISEAKDGKSLRQKWQFHDTKVAQDHNNYNTLEGFGSTTFIDDHRLGIVHPPIQCHHCPLSHGSCGWLHRLCIETCTARDPTSLRARRPEPGQQGALWHSKSSGKYLRWLCRINQ